MKRHALLLAAAAALALTGCNQNVIQQCPSAAVLSDTAVLTVMRPGAPADLSGEAYTATMGSVTNSCSFSRTAGAATSSNDFTIRVTRAPSPDGLRVTLPYFIALTQGERILNKKNLTITLEFAPGASSITQEITPEDTVVPLEIGHPPTDYQLLFGFQLTDAQRAYAQTRTRFIP